MKARAGRHRVKVVLGTNVVVFAAFRGIPDQAVEKAMAFCVLISPPIVAELKRVAAKLEPKLTTAQRVALKRLVRRIASKARMVAIPTLLGVCRDSKDDVYLETCQVSRVHALVTGDRGLLDVDRETLKQHRMGRLAIVTPADFVTRS